MNCGECNRLERMFLESMVFLDRAQTALPTSASKRRMVPLATPERRTVERTEQPSNRAAVTATFLSALRLYAMNQEYNSALA